MTMFPEDIVSLIPQRPPFVMIDQLVYRDEQTTRSRLLVREGNVLVENGIFSAAGLVEHMAQTVAAGAGYKAVQEAKAVQTGYIAAVKNLEISTLPQVGD